jgi:phytanoyl-CoA hydroxylase
VTTPTQTDQVDFARQGWCLVPSLFTETEVSFYLEHFMYMHANRAEDWGWENFDPDSDDPLTRFPRIGMMHRWDRLSAEWLIDARFNTWLRALLGQVPYAVQTMIYYKPPGARGQALHQDQYYLQVDPGTCVAAWLALDDCDEQNGCLQIVPGTHDIPVLCPVAADTTQSFTDVTVPLPEGLAPQSVHMRAGDVLFFNGQLVHGSFPNRTQDRFRRSLIGHYIVAEAEQIARHYHPVLQMNGEPLDFGMNTDGGLCGTWVATEPPTVEISDSLSAYKS